MCQSTVYARRGRAAEELLLDEVARIVVDGGKVSMTTLFGEPLTVTGRVCEIDLMKHRVVLQCE